MVMTTPHLDLAAAPELAAPRRVPLARAARLATGASLALAGITNGLSQYLGEALTGGNDTFSDAIRTHAGSSWLQAEQIALTTSMLFLAIGILGLLQIVRWRTPRLTVVAAVLLAWGLWGFHNVAALSFTSAAVAPGAIGVDQAVALNDAYSTHAGTMIIALVPHLIGSFVGMVLLVVAAWRSRSMPRIPLVLWAIFLVWDFGLPAAGWLEPHILLFVAWAWLGAHVLRMSDEAWHGGTPALPNRSVGSPY